MKLFYYDTKHQQIIVQKDMGDLSEKEVNLVNSVLEFLEDSLLTDGRYKDLTLANNVEIIYEDGEPQLVIT